jgi:hypothetical protein
MCVVLWWCFWAGLNMCCALVEFLVWALYVLCSGGVPELGFICVVLWWCYGAGFYMCCALVVFLG